MNLILDRLRLMPSLQLRSLRIAMHEDSPHLQHHSGNCPSPYPRFASRRLMPVMPNSVLGLSNFQRASGYCLQVLSMSERVPVESMVKPDDVRVPIQPTVKLDAGLVDISRYFAVRACVFAYGQDEDAAEFWDAQEVVKLFHLRGWHDRCKTMPSRAAQKRLGHFALEMREWHDERRR